METLTYSSDRYSELNEARRALWSAKNMLGHANAEPHLYDKSLWMGQINVHRAQLRQVAYRMRAAQCAPTASN